MDVVLVQAVIGCLNRVNVERSLCGVAPPRPLRRKAFHFAPTYTDSISQLLLH